MIYKVEDYWVADGQQPTIEDVREAAEIAKKCGHTVCLHWKGPGYQWYADTYSRDITPDSDPEKIFNTLPKIYGA